MSPSIYLCSECNSPNVLQDAWVPVNDPDDVRIMDHMFCEQCDGGTSIIKYEQDGPSEYIKVGDDVINVYNAHMSGTAVAEFHGRYNVLWGGNLELLQWALDVLKEEDDE